MENGKTFFIGIIAILFFMISFKGCFKDSDQSQQRVSERQTVYEKSPVDILIRDLSNEQAFTIILYDMDYSEASDKYKHEYNVIVERDDSVYSQNTEWAVVSSAFFKANVDNMGMELASKKDGKINKSVAPAGYSNYIGNQKYGQWQERDGNRFWEFYGKYAFMSSMFRMAMFPVGYSNWNNYHTNYYGQGRGYYGTSSNGSRMYGTNSNYTKANNSSTWNNKSSDFKSRVQSKVSRSTASNSRVNRSSTTKRTRSSSRYSSSNTRSRGGSFGK